MENLQQIKIIFRKDIPVRGSKILELLRNKGNNKGDSSNNLVVDTDRLLDYQLSTRTLEDVKTQENG